MRQRQKESDHEAVRQKSRLNLRRLDLYSHLGRFVVTDNTGVVGDLYCADLRQVVPVDIKEETPQGFVLEAEVLVHCRAGFRSNLAACPGQSEVPLVSRVESEVRKKIEDDQPNFGRDGEQPKGRCSVSIPHQIGIAEL